MSHPAAPRRTSRRRWVRPALAAAFVVVPLVEIWAILQVGRIVGPWWTIALLVLDSVATVPLILESPRTRSTNSIGTSVTTSPAASVRATMSVWKT